MEEQDISVEKYLELKFEEMILDFRKHTANLVEKLKNEQLEASDKIHKLIKKESQAQPLLCLTLKCIEGPHIGQKFRLEEDKDAAFKMGRSTGKAFKEKGISLYKDKEISLSHAKIEIKNGQSYVIDTNSTNGTLLNGEEISTATPYRLQDGDKITLGSTVLLAHLSPLEVIE